MTRWTNLTQRHEGTNLLEIRSAGVQEFRMGRVLAAPIDCETCRERLKIIAQVLQPWVGH
jgi:hypothetical protein